MQRFLSGWNRVGAISVRPGDALVDIGEVVMAAGADSIWVRVSQQGGESPWPWGFGLLTWKSAQGRELGTQKVYGHLEGEVFRLGVGLSPVERGGRLLFTPRAYNLRWLEAGGTSWDLAFDAITGTSGGGGVSGFIGGFVDVGGQGLEMARVVFP